MSDTSIVLRPATPADVEAIFQLILALAEYEKLSHTVTGTPESLEKHLFSPRPYADAIVAQVQEKIVGFALYFYNYSTFLTLPGIYLEDLFVLPEYRGKGIGKAMLCYLARLALSGGFGRLEWSVLNWNEPAIGFYQKMGADVLPDWRICRVTGDNLSSLAQEKV